MIKDTFGIFLFSAVFTLTTYAQEGFYYYGVNSKTVETREDARFFKDLEQISKNRYLIKSYIYQSDSWVRSKKERIKVSRDNSQRIIYNTDKLIPSMIHRRFSETGNGIYKFEESNNLTTIRTGTSTKLLPLHLEGSVKVFYNNGQLKSHSIYRDNQLISNENWLSDGSKYIDSIFYSVDAEPIYHMAVNYFRNYIISKLIESKLNLQEFDDEVLIGFVIMETGQIRGARALKGKSLQLNQILVSAIANLPGEWSPAMLDDTPVRYFKTIPFNFMQNGAQFQNLEISGGMLLYDSY